jgi:N-acetylglucosamine malate deacetylase 1
MGTKTMKQGIHSPVVVFAPHTDDGEIGCGGLIAYAIEKGIDVYYVAFSSAQISLPEGVPKNILIQEVKKATAVLGIPPENLIIYSFPTRHFPAHRQEILEKMIEIRLRVNPKLVLTPSLNDIHQDHATVAHETLRAFKKQSILCYEEPWNNISFSTNCFITLGKRHIQKKIDALMCYESQKRRTYLTADAVWALALTRGSQLEGGYAEAYEVVRWMINENRDNNERPLHETQQNN